MQAVPRPPARRLLCGRFLVPRVALLALPAGPVLGVDLGSGEPISLELLPAGGDLGDRPAAAGAREAGTHLGRIVVVSAPVAAVPAVAHVLQPPRALPGAALRRELGSRRGRVTLAAGALVAGALVCSSLLGGTTPRTRAAPLPPSVEVPAPLVDAPRITPPAVARVPPVARGGAARVLVFARPRHPVAIPVAPPRAPQVEPRRRAARRSPGWVDGLVVGP